MISLTLKVPEKFQLYGLYVYYVVHICDFGMLRVNETQIRHCVRVVPRVDDTKVDAQEGLSVSRSGLWQPL